MSCRTQATGSTKERWSVRSCLGGCLNIQRGQRSFLRGNTVQGHYLHSLWSPLKDTKTSKQVYSCNSACKNITMKMYVPFLCFVV